MSQKKTRKVRVRIIDVRTVTEQQVVTVTVPGDTPEDTLGSVVRERLDEDDYVDEYVETIDSVSCLDPVYEIVHPSGVMEEI